jgi:hypothetical protein
MNLIFMTLYVQVFFSQKRVLFEQYLDKGGHITIMTKLYFKRLIQLSLLFVGTVFLQAEDNTTRNPDTIRIMPLGDSITYDTRVSDITAPRAASARTGYRSHLWYMLQDADYHADFVGSQVAGQAVNPPFDPDNEGHPGWTTFNIESKTYDYTLNSRPDIVLLHVGTNDHDSFAGGLDGILNEINRYEEDTGKSVRVIVALIIDRRDHDPIIPFYNANVKKVVAAHITAGDKITLVDMYRNAGLVDRDYSDNTHPTNSGYYKIATVWFNELMKPYNPALTAFPYTLAPAEQIEAININTTATAVEVTTRVPESGILF